MIMTAQYDKSRRFETPPQRVEGRYILDAMMATIFIIDDSSAVSRRNTS